MEGSTSCSKDLPCGVPQGSVLGPILYLLRTSPLGEMIRNHGSFKFQDQAVSVQTIESCLNDAWMLTNMLKLNKDKTELLVIGPKHKVIPPIEGIHVVGEYIKVSSSGKKYRCNY